MLTNYNAMHEVRHEVYKMGWLIELSITDTVRIVGFQEINTSRLSCKTDSISIIVARSC